MEQSTSRHSTDQIHKERLCHKRDHLIMGAVLDQEM